PYGARDPAVGDGPGVGRVLGRALRSRSGRAARVGLGAGPAVLREDELSERREHPRRGRVAARAGRAVLGLHRTPRRGPRGGDPPGRDGEGDDMKHVPCPTAEDALSQALVAALDSLSEDRLTEADFGQFSDRSAGWYWTLTFARRVTSDHRHLREMYGKDT